MTPPVTDTEDTVRALARALHRATADAPDGDVTWYFEGSREELAAALDKGLASEGYFLMRVQHGSEARAIERGQFMGEDSVRVPKTEWTDVLLFAQFAVEHLALVLGEEHASVKAGRRSLAALSEEPR